MLWILALSYWVHLLATVIWLGSLVLMGLVALPAWQKQSLTDNQWLLLQKGLTPWVNSSMALIWITGFIQMTKDEQYNGFLALDSEWAWALLVKHVAVIVMTGLTLVVQLRIYPAMQRLELLRGKESAEVKHQVLVQQEIRLLRLNLLFSTIVLLCTAIATAL